MNKAQLCNIIRSKYPKALGIRKTLQKIKVKRLSKYMLSKEEISACENNPMLQSSIIALYLEKWSDYLKPVIEEMEDILKNAPAYRIRKDKDALRADIIFCRLAYGFLPSEYVGFELESKTPLERKQFISDIETLEFGYSVNDISKLQAIVDKAKSFQQFGKYFCRDAVVISKEKDFDLFHAFVTSHPVFVKKYTNSSQGKHVELVDINAVGMSEQEYFCELISQGKMLLEERVVQHELMSKFNESSVNTVRCITMKIKDDIVVPYCFMRTGRNGSFVDNGGAGGILIGIDVENGVLNTDGFDEYMERFVAHPDTKVQFIGSVIPEWNNMIEFCKNAASKVKDIGYLSWDMAYTEKGWVVIEVNGIGQLIGPQIVWRRGIKEEIRELLKDIELVI